MPNVLFPRVATGVAAPALVLLLSFGTFGCKKAAPVSDAEAFRTSTVSSANPTTPSEAVDQMIQNFQRVHFAFDQSRLDASSKAALRANAELLRAFPALSVEIEGHADERGTTAYNLALGARRAQAVRDSLVSEGIAGSRIRTVSYGEERPLASGSHESAWAQNRRAEFRVYGAEGVGGSAR